MHLPSQIWYVEHSWYIHLRLRSFQEQGVKGNKSIQIEIKYPFGAGICEVPASTNHQTFQKWMGLLIGNMKACKEACWGWGLHSSRSQSHCSTSMFNQSLPPVPSWSLSLDSWQKDCTIQSNHQFSRSWEGSPNDSAAKAAELATDSKPIDGAWVQQSAPLWWNPANPQMGHKQEGEAFFSWRKVCLTPCTQQWVSSVHRTWPAWKTETPSDAWQMWGELVRMVTHHSSKEHWQLWAGFCPQERGTLMRCSAEMLWKCRRLENLTGKPWQVESSSTRHTSLHHSINEKSCFVFTSPAM